MNSNGYEVHSHKAMMVHWHLRLTKMQEIVLKVISVVPVSTCLNPSLIEFESSLPPPPPNKFFFLVVKSQNDKNILNLTDNTFLYLHLSRDRTTLKEDCLTMYVNTLSDYSLMMLAAIIQFNSIITDQSTQMHGLIHFISAPIK